MNCKLEICFHLKKNLLEIFSLSFCLETKRNKKFKKRSSAAAQAGHTPATFSGLRA
jgi:hypothetical protein